MRKLLNISIAILALLCATSCVNENGSQTTQVPQVGKVVPMQRFADINIVGSMQVFYTQGENHSVRVEAEPKAFERLLIYVKGNELFVTSKESQQLNMESMENVKVYVTSPNLIEVSVTGSGIFTATKKVQLANLDVELTGSGVVAFDDALSCKNLDVELTGSGSVKLAGAVVKKLSTKVTGTGDVNYYNLKAERAESNISGTGTITMNGTVGEHVKNITGTGKIVVK